MNPLSHQEKAVIINGHWLEGDHMERFANLLKKYSDYDMQGTWKVQHRDTIIPVSPNTQHIQILHSCENVHTNEDGHWICSYYNRHSILIYDSANKNKLHRHHKIYLEKLFPFYPFDKKSVKFIRVQHQSNGNDCGVFAIAFAITLLFELRPEKVKYDIYQMR